MPPPAARTARPKRNSASLRPKKLRFPVRLAAIDVGSSAIRFLIAEFSAKNRFTTLFTDRAPVRLGHGVYLSGRLNPASMEAGIKALADFRAVMKRFRVRRYRAVATSAVRESKNGDQFLERVKRETGFELEVIAGLEEARLFYVAVRQRLRLGPEPMVLADLGGGSIEVALVDNSGILWIESHTMGSVRLLEELAEAGEDPGRFRRLVAEYISTLRLPTPARNRAPAGFIATGGNIEALARLAGARPRPDGVAVLPVADLNRVIDQLSRLSYRQRVETLGLREDRADTILPAALLYERLCVLAGQSALLVPFVGVREGILLDLVDDLATHRAHDDRRQDLIYDGALALGRRYQFDEDHAVHVTRLALSLFDQLPRLHKLGEIDRHLLTAAGLLHDTGAFISTRRHHKHSFYLISQSEIPGLTPRETLLAAHVARYHRKSEPGSQHPPFLELTALEQDRVVRLAGILRLADALDREHLQRVRSLRAAALKNTVTLHLLGSGDLLLERWALQRKAGLFQRAFNIKLKLGE